MQVSIKNDIHKGICDHGEGCCPHEVEGKLTGCNCNVYSNGQPIALVGDTVTHNCPHCGTGVISSSTSNIYINGKQVAGIDCEVKYEKGKGKITSAGGKIYNG